MLGRVTQNMLNSRLVDDLGGLTQRISDAQQKVSTGKQINQPSDDPLGTQRALSLRSSIEGTQQYERNVDSANGWLQSTDDALSQVSDIVQRVQELTVQGASDSNGPAARESIALEIDQLVGAIKQNANATYQGAYIFSGTATTTAPYASGSDTYQGDTGVVARSIGPGVSVPVNTVGSDLFGSGQASGDGKLLDTLETIAAHLRSSVPADHAALQTTDLQQLQANSDALSSARGAVGAVMSRLNSAKSRLSDMELTTTTLLSNTEDVDITQAYVDLSNQQNVYQAALRSGASIIQPSLLDFLSS